MTEMTFETKGTCEKYKRYAKIVFAVVSIVVSIFDLGTDWFSFSVFVRNDGENLAVAYVVVCTLSTILFPLEIHNGVMAYRVYTREPTEAGGIADKEGKLDHWEEVVSFLPLCLEDFPTIVIMYITFQKGNCRLYNKVFETTFTANLALLGTLVSSVWKGVLSLRYCFTFKFRHVECGCCIKSCCCCIKSCCCCCRMIRPLVACTLLGLTAALYVAFNKGGGEPRDDRCANYGMFNNTTLAP